MKHGTAMYKRIFSHLVLIFALLFAQHAGFLHALSHVSSTQAPRAHGFSPKPDAPFPEKAPHRTQVCLQCLAITLSDGAVDARSPAAVVVAAGVAPTASAEPRSAQQASSPFFARAPPAIA
jgi:hypothetical protein